MISRLSRLRITIPLLIALVVAIASPAYAGTSKPMPAKNSVTAPVFKSVSVSKTTVNAGETVTVDVYADGGGSALSSGSITWETPSGQWVGTDLEYDQATGKLTGAFAVNKYAEPGKWTCVMLTIFNEDAEFTDVDEASLSGASLTVINDNPDVEAPSVASVLVSPARLTAGDEVKVTVKATDDLSGVKRGAVTFGNGSKQLLGPSINALLEYNSAKGVLEGTAVVPDDAPAGEWALYTLEISDNAGNIAFLTDADLKDQGVDVSKATFTVSAVKTAVNDIVPPVIMSPTNGDRYALQLVDQNPKKPGFQVTVSGWAVPGYKVELVSGGKTIAKANNLFSGTGWAAEITISGELTDIYAIAIAPNGNKSDKTCSITRAQAAKLVVKSTGSDPETAHHGYFKDVPASNPYAKYIESAVVRSFIETDTSGLFKPNDPISRGEFTQWAYNSIIQIVEGGPSAPEEDTTIAMPASDEPYFLDVPESSPYAEAITAMHGMGEISGNPNGTFKPNNRLSACLKLTGFANMKLSDVKSTDWCAPYIFDLMLDGIVTGYKGGVYMPRQTITRAEFAKMLCKVKGWSVSETAAADCVDVPPSHWAHSYVKTLRQNGVVDGYACNSFKADQALSRAEAVKMIVRTQGYKLDTTSETFPDIIGSWASDFILTARKYNLVTGYPDGSFQPDGTITRAEAAKLIWQLL